MSNSSNKKNNKWLIFTQIPAQMGIIIYIFYQIGKWIDEKYQIDSEIGKNSLTLIGVFIALYQVYSLVKKLNK